MNHTIWKFYPRVKENQFQNHHQHQKRRNPLQTQQDKSNKFPWPPKRRRNWPQIWGGWASSTYPKFQGSFSVRVFLERVSILRKLVIRKLENFLNLSIPKYKPWKKGNLKSNIVKNKLPIWISWNLTLRSFFKIVSKIKHFDIYRLSLLSLFFYIQLFSMIV